MRTITILFILSIPTSAWCCEPIAAWVVFAGPHALPMSLAGLFGIIAIKCASFAFFDRNLPVYQRPFYMFTANLFSSLVGFAIAFPFAVPASLMFFAIALTIVGVVSVGPSRRINLLLGRPNISGGLIILPLVVLMFLTMVLFVSATGALDSNLFWLYWLLKLSYVGVAFAVSIGISTLFEEFAISYLSRKSGSEISFMAPVFQANLVAFLVGSAVGAAYMLPKRLESPNFLVKIFDLLYSAIS